MTRCFICSCFGLLALIEGSIFAAPATPRDEYLYLFSQFDTDGFSSASESQGDLSGQGDSLAPAGLPKGRRLNVASARYGNVVFLRPKTDRDEKNLLTCSGQKIKIRTKNVFNVLFSLGTAIRGRPGGWIRFHFDDGTSAPGPLGMSGLSEAAYFGEEVAYTLQYNEPGGAKRNPPRSAKIWLQRTPIPRKKRIVAITLPKMKDVKLLGLTLGYREGLEPIEPPIDGPTPSPAQVAILAEPGFPSYKSTLPMAPERLQKLLAESGISSQLLRASHLEDPSAFTAENFPVLVNLYGKAFPKQIDVPLRAYRKGGGAMVHTGQPMTHPCRRSVYGGWFDPGSTKLYEPTDTPAGLGLGSALYVRADSSLTASADTKLLGLENIPWNEVRLLPDNLMVRSLRPQGIDTKSLDADDVVVPLIAYEGQKAPFAALVRHNDAKYRGAIDIWTGTTAYSWRGNDRAGKLQEEVLLRCVALALLETQRISKERFDSLTETLSPEQVEVPGPKIAGRAALSVHEADAPEELLIIDVRKYGTDERNLAASLQGLINRSGKKALFLSDGVREENFGKAFATRGTTKSTRSSNMEEALLLLGHKRAVVYDAELFGSLNLATMISSLENLLLASPSLARKHGLEIAMDLRGLFSDGDEMMAWTYENLWPRFAGRPLVFYPPTVERAELRDYIIAERAFVFWIPTFRARSNHGARPESEYSIIRKILSEAPTPLQIIGLAGNGSTRGLGNDFAARVFSEHGKYFTAMGVQRNLSLVRRQPPVPKSDLPNIQAPRNLEISSDRIYVALIDRPVSHLPARYTPGPALELEAKFKVAPHGIVSRPEYTAFFAPEWVDALANSPDACIGIALPTYLRTEYFGSVFRAQAEEARRALGEDIARWKPANASFFVASDLDTSWLVNLPKELPPGACVLVDHSTEELRHPLEAHELVGKLPVFHDVGALAVAEVIRAGDGVDLYSSTGPHFFYAERQALARAIKAEEISDKVVFVRPDEMAMLYIRLREYSTPMREKILSETSRWKYNDTGEALAPSWKLPGFDDGSWIESDGEFGYGDNDETTVLSFGEDAQNKHPCYYFRKKIEIKEKRNIKLLLGEYICDDGLVLYINGKEVHRYNMPEGKIEYATFAVQTISSSTETRWIPVSIDPKHLKKGENTMAVELHQRSASSSDLGFNFRLSTFGWTEQDL